MTRIDEIRARLAAATPGEWLVDDYEVSSAGCDTYRSFDEYDEHDPWLYIEVCGSADPTTRKANAALIAAAPADLAWLLSEVERLTAERDGATAAERERAARVCEAEAAEWAQAAAEDVDPASVERFSARALQASENAAAIRRGGE